MNGTNQFPNRVRDDNGVYWYEEPVLVTFGSTNVVGNVYFAEYFTWQGHCREAILARLFPEVTTYLDRGFSLITDCAHMDYAQEARLFDSILVRLGIVEVARTRLEFCFEFVRAEDGAVLARGGQAVVWVNEQGRPSLMPDKLYDIVREYYRLEDRPRVRDLATRGIEAVAS